VGTFVDDHLRGRNLDGIPDEIRDGIFDQRPSLELRQMVLFALLLYHQASLLPRNSLK
jgi:hypothetical protein